MGLFRWISILWRGTPAGRTRKGKAPYHLRTNLDRLGTNPQDGLSITAAFAAVHNTPYSERDYPFATLTNSRGDYIQVGKGRDGTVALEWRFNDGHGPGFTHHRIEAANPMNTQDALTVFTSLEALGLTRPANMLLPWTDVTAEFRGA